MRRFKNKWRKKNQFEKKMMPLIVFALHFLSTYDSGASIQVLILFGRAFH